jgi:hypothetical protein
MTVNKNVLIVFALAVVLAVIGFVAGWNIARDSSGHDPEVVRDTIVRVDTCNVILPPDTITKTELKTVYVPQTNIIVVNDSTYSIELPFEQHLMSMKDTLDVWFSGVDAKIDSLHLYVKNTTIEIEKTPKQQLFTFYGGAGVDWMDGTTAYKMFVEAEAALGKKIKVSADGGLAVFDKTASPYVAVTLKYKFN